MADKVFAFISFTTLRW